MDLLTDAFVAYFKSYEKNGWLHLAPHEGALRAALYAEHAVLEERSAADGSQWLHIRLREKHYHQIQSKYNRRLELQTHSDIP